MEWLKTDFQRWYDALPREKKIEWDARVWHFLRFGIGLFVIDVSALVLITAGVVSTLVAFPFSLLFASLWGAYLVWNFRHYMRNLQPAQTPFRERLEERLRTAIVEHDYAYPPKELFDRILNVGEQICKNHESYFSDYANLSDPQKQSLLEGRLPEGHHDHLFAAVTKSLTAYIARLPRFHPQPFSRPLPITNSLIFEMKDPFSTTPGGKWIIDQFNRNVGAYSDRIKAKEPIYADRYQGPPEEIAETYFRGLPLLPLLQITVPFQPFSELNRCAHHWCLGPTRRGKTTFLRHLIRADLDAVAKGECSLVVIDSKDKGLVHEMRTLKQFEPGGPLDGKLILIDSDTPFPLNPFAMENKAMARNLITYMLSENMSQVQAGVLGFYVDSVIQSRVKTFQTLLDYIRLPLKKRPSQKFDDELDAWWNSTRDKVHDQTISSIEVRLSVFMREHRGAPILKNLQADSWSLDLYKELHEGGKVLLVDPDHHKNGAVGASLMGRMFIALIENLAARRQKAPTPVWVYIDEVTDYLKKKEPSFIQILIKAAGAKVGMAVAYQVKGLIDSEVELALTNAEIHSMCEQRGRVDLTIEKRPLTLAVPELEFTSEPQMLPAQYQELRRTLAQQFPYQQNKQEDFVEPKTYK